MLVAVIGTLWVVSFIGALAFSTVAYDLIVTPGDDEYRPAYVLTGRRLLTTLFLSLATFYAGLSRNVDKLPPLVEYRLTMQPITLWPAYVWLILAVAFLGMAAISELIGMDWRRSFDFSGLRVALLRGRRTTPAAMAAEILQRPHPSVDYLQPRQIQLEENPLGARRRWYWGQLNGMGTAAAVLLVALLGLFALNRIGFFGAIGRVAANYSINTILPGDRSTPTPTPIIGEAWAVVADGDEPATAESADQPVAASAPQSTATTVATLPPASTPAPTPTATPEARITVNNAAGVNARRSPDLNGEVVQVLLPGTSAAVIGEERQGDWIPVRLAEGSEAWVFADVVALSRPLAGTISVSGSASINETIDTGIDETVGETAAVEASAVVAVALPTSVADTQQQPASNQSTTGALGNDEPVVGNALPAQEVRSSSFSGAITLLEPAADVVTSGQTIFRWEAPPTGSDRAYEVVLWRDGESPLADGASLGAPTKENRLTVDLNQRSLEAGKRLWGVLLVQTRPYRRLAHLSSGRTIEVRR